MTKDKLNKIREQRLAETNEINAKFEDRKKRNAKSHWNSSPISWERAAYEIDKQLD